MEETNEMEREDKAEVQKFRQRAKRRGKEKW